MTDARVFRGFRFPAEVILWAVCWYPQFPISYRDLERMLADRGVSVDHTVLKLLIPLSQRFLTREPWGDDAEVATPAALGPEELDLLVGACSFPAAGQLIRD